MECNKCDKVFCAACLDQYQYTEIKKKKLMGGSRDEYCPNVETVNKMECPKYHTFYGYTPLDNRDRAHAYGGLDPSQSVKPRKKLNNFVKSFVLE